MDNAHGVLHWEKLAVGEPKHELMYTTIHRCKVTGGWLVALLWTAVHHGGGPALTFLPDPEHAWDGNSLPSEFEQRLSV